MKKRSVSNKIDRRAWLFILPSLILIICFVFYPMVQAFLTSFQTGIANNTEFGGIANYQRMLTDSTFKKSLFNTVLYLIVQVPVMIIQKNGNTEITDKIVRRIYCNTFNAFVFLLILVTYFHLNKGQHYNQHHDNIRYCCRITKIRLVFKQQVINIL